jgi:hypothetical protein
VKLSLPEIRHNRLAFLSHCERSEAIQNPAAVTNWIASLRSQ